MKKERRPDVLSDRKVKGYLYPREKKIPEIIGKQEKVSEPVQNLFG
jgi:hypothetical protein